MIELTIKGNKREMNPVLRNLSYFLPCAKKNRDITNEVEREIVYHVQSKDTAKVIIMETLDGQEIRIPFLQLIHADMENCHIFAGTVYDIFAGGPKSC
jgi:hypothetical protein